MIWTVLNLVKLVQISVKQCSEQRHPHKLFLLDVNVILTPVRSMPSTQLLSEVQLLLFLLPSSPKSRALLRSHISSNIQHLRKAMLVMRNHLIMPKLIWRGAKNQLMLPHQPGQGHRGGNAESPDPHRPQHSQECALPKEQLEGRGLGWA